MKILIKNAKILTRYDKDIFSGNLLIEDNIIKTISKNEILEQDFDRVIDAKNNLIMPGFIDCHTHSPMTILKGVGEDEGLESWLFDNIVKYESKLIKQDIYYATKLAIFEYLKNGITTVNEMYAINNKFSQIAEISKAFYESGLRAVVQIDEDNIEVSNKVFEQIKNFKPLVTGSFGCHSVYLANEARFNNAIKLSRQHNTIISTHMSETITEVGNCVKQHDLTPVALLESYGFFDRPAIVFHAVHLDKEDINILKHYNASVCSNPCSNLKLGSGIAPINALVSKGVNVCLGTDGSASNNRLDMFREMYLIACLQKGIMHDGSIIPCELALQIATYNGAKALNNDRIGELKEGNFADLIMINLNGINNATSVNLKSNLVYASGTEDVLMTMVNGKILYENGKFNLDINLEDVIVKCKEIIKRLDIKAK